MHSAVPRRQLATHEVTNQPPEWVGQNLYLSDSAFREAARREGGTWVDAPLLAAGELYGSASVLVLGDAANRNPPVLHSFNRFGERLDEVEFHPAWHVLMEHAMRLKIHSIAWQTPRAGQHVAHAALLALAGQAEQGHTCPISMTYASVPVLRQRPDIAALWLPKVVDGVYDAPLRHVSQKAGVTIGMAMTEKQGGSDVRANTTRAEPISQNSVGQTHSLTGHKWFCSAPMSDAFLTLAQTAQGLSCFLVPRILENGERNKIQIMRLKDKLGNRANASAEIEYHGALATLIGEAGRGIPTILDMVHHTRLDTLAGTLGIMRMALAQANHHVRHRLAFQRRLIDQPVMRAVIADLQLEYEAAVAITFRIARAFDATEGDEKAFARLAVACAKFWLTRRTPHFVFECLECLGGAGYIEEGPMPRLYREAPLNSIWEGSGNVIALDILRTLQKEPRALIALRREVEAAMGQNHDLDAAATALWRDIAGPLREAQARAIAERLCLVLQAALLVSHAPAAIAQVFCASRLGGCHGIGTGTLDASADVDAILLRT